MLVHAGRLSVLRAAAADAPAAPGVYFFLGENDRLLYVGKAGDLRRRLGDHARTPSSTRDRRSRARLSLVRTVRWEVCADEEDAFAREADLIVLLKPRFNASHTGQDPNLYVRVANGPKGTILELTGGVADHGCFPHLAKGSFSHTAKRSKAGYNALLRLLWASEAGELAATIPGRIAGPSPPVVHVTPMRAELRPLLDDYLTGRGAALVPALWDAIAASAIPDYMQPALDRDAAAAVELFTLGPARMRMLRARHDLGDGPVSPKIARQLLRAEVGCER